MKFLTQKDFKRIKQIGEIFLIIGLLSFIIGLFWREQIVILSGAIGISLIAAGISCIITALLGNKSTIKAKERLRKLGINPDNQS
jgi:uncharacterized membrane protein HdeD (DUF308 family)